MTYPKLSEALQVGNLLIPNRIVMPPLVIFAAARPAQPTESEFKNSLDHFRPVECTMYYTRCVAGSIRG